MPPGPRFRLRGGADASSRSRIDRISAIRSGPQGAASIASRTAARASSKNAGSPQTGRARVSDCRSHTWAPPAAKYRRNSPIGTARLPLCPVGRSRMSTAYSRPIGPRWLSALISRRAYSVKYSYRSSDFGPAVFPSPAYTTTRSRSLW